MAAHFDQSAEWIGRCILPWEAEVRAWLRRASVSPSEIDDIIQEAYSRLLDHQNHAQILNPRAYFRQVARNILYEQLRRSRIIRIDSVAEMDSLNISDSAPSQERAVIAKEELNRLKQTIDALPEKCRKIFVMRKIESLSQKQIAERLNVTENVVEAQVRRGWKLVLNAWAEGTHGTSSERNDESQQIARRKFD